LGQAHKGETTMANSSTTGFGLRMIERLMQVDQKAFYKMLVSQLQTTQVMVVLLTIMEMNHY